MNRYPEYRSVKSYWFDEIPSHWKTMKNKFIFFSDKCVVGEDWCDYTLLTMGKEGVRVRDMDGGGKFPESFETYQVVKPNQIIFCLFDIDETPRSVGLSNIGGMITSAYDVFSCEDEISPIFVNYFYQSIDDVKGLKPYYTGLRKVVRPDTFLGITIYIPPLPEQTLIAQYLDKKTSQIDTLISKIEQKIELLKEQRTSLVNQCVTKGLNPDVEMKDSGVEWIGEIPSHWKVNRLGCLHIDQFGGSWGDDPIENQIEDLVKVIRVTEFDYTRLQVLEDIPTVRSLSISDGHIKLVKKGDLILEKSGGGEKTPVGRLVMVNHEIHSPTINSNFTNLIKIDPNTVNPRFVTYLYSCAYDIGVTKRNIKQTTGIQNLDLSGLFSETVFTPPLPEQTLIAQYLDKKTSQIDEVIGKNQNKLNLLKEYRQSLISNVVTGKVMVTEDMV